jgi:hypothetical protein
LSEEETTEAAGVAEAATAAAINGEPVVVSLREPVKLGAVTVDSLTLKPSGRAFRNFSLPMTADGGILFQPYELAAVGVKMAGHPAILVDKLHPADLIEVAQAVMGFLGGGLKIGSTTSR